MVASKAGSKKDVDSPEGVVCDMVKDTLMLACVLRGSTGTNGEVTEQADHTIIKYVTNLATPEKLYARAKDILTVSSNSGASKDAIVAAFTTVLLSLATPRFEEAWINQAKAHEKKIAAKGVSPISTSKNFQLDMICNLLRVAIVCIEISHRYEEDRAQFRETKLVVVDKMLCFGLIEKTLDLIDVDSAAILLNFMETNLQSLTKGLKGNTGEALTLLRMCNEFNRRLSKTKHTITSGRLLLFVASIFDLHERSGVNLRGEYNTSNETGFHPFTDVFEENIDKVNQEIVRNEGLQRGKPNQQRGRGGSNSATSAAPPGNTRQLIQLSTKTVPNVVLCPLDNAKIISSLEGIDLIQSQVDGNDFKLLYNRIWTLTSEYFNNPMKIIDCKRVGYPVGVNDDTPVADFDLFVNLCDSVLCFFEQLYGNAKNASNNNNNGNSRNPTRVQLSKSDKTTVNNVLERYLSKTYGDKSMDVEDVEPEEEVDEDDSSFFPKYLTKKSLFQLQLKDPDFCKQFCGQISIIYQFLLQLTTDFQSKLKALAASKNLPLNKALQLQLNRCPMLTTVQETAIRANLERCIIILNNVSNTTKTALDPKSFIKSFSITSQYSVQWDKWKYFNCQNYHQTANKDMVLEIQSITKRINRYGFKLLKKSRVDKDTMNEDEDNEEPPNKMSNALSDDTSPTSAKSSQYKPDQFLEPNLIDPMDSTSKLTLPKAVTTPEFIGNSNISELWVHVNKIEQTLQEAKDFRMKRSRWGS